MAATLTGWSPEEARGEPLDQVFNAVSEESRQPIDNPVLLALRAGHVVRLSNHTVLIAKGGTEWPIDDSAAPIRDRAGVVDGAVLVFQEIGQHRRQEQELRRQAVALQRRRAQRTVRLMLAHDSATR